MMKSSVFSLLVIGDVLFSSAATAAAIVDRANRMVSIPTHWNAGPEQKLMAFLEIGSQKTRMEVVMDTGSNIGWVLKSRIPIDLPGIC